MGESKAERGGSVRHSARPPPGLVTADGSPWVQWSWTAAEHEKPGWIQLKSTKQQEMVWLAASDRAEEGGGMSTAVNFHIKELCCMGSSYCLPCNNSYLALWAAMEETAVHRAMRGQCGQDHMKHYINYTLASVALRSSGLPAFSQPLQRRISCFHIMDFNVHFCFEKGCHKYIFQIH